MLRQDRTMETIMATTANKTQTPLYPILGQLRDQLRAYLGDSLEALILFGSYSRGEAQAESDIDVLVVVDWLPERLPNGFYRSFGSDPRWRKIIELAYDISLNYGVYISTLVMTHTEFLEGMALVRQIKREGQVIWQSQKLNYMLI